MLLLHVLYRLRVVLVFFFQAEDGIRDGHVTGVQTCALPISFDSVEKGEILGYVAPKDSVLLNVQLNLLQSEMNYIRESMDPLMNLQRNRMNFESLKIEEIETRIVLAQAESNHQEVTAEHVRAGDLMQK